MSDVVEMHVGQVRFGAEAVPESVQASWAQRLFCATRGERPVTGSVEGLEDPSLGEGDLRHPVFSGAQLQPGNRGRPSPVPRGAADRKKIT